MGAGKSTALAAARGEGLPTVEIDELMEASFGSTIPQAFEQPRRGGLPRARGRGRRLAAGGGRRRRRDRARRRQRALAADPRRDGPPHRRLAAGRRDRGLAPHRPLRPPAGELRRVGRHPARDPPAALRRAGRRGGADGRPPDRPPRPADDPPTCAELPAGTKLLWASAPGGEYPVLVGRGLLDCDWWPLESRRFLVTDRSVGAALRGAARAARRDRRNRSGGDRQDPRQHREGAAGDEPAKG